MLYENEKIDDLLENSLRIIRREDVFAYGSDAVALAAFAVLSKKDIALDIGTGTGILAILLASRSGAHFTAVEIDEYMADMARRSVELNSMQDKISVLCGDIRNMYDVLSYERFSVIVCNPPYFAQGTLPDDGISRNSTHEGTLDMDGLALCASKLLKNGGKLFMVYPAARFAGCVSKLTAHNLMPKRVKPVYTDSEKRKFNCLLIEARKGGKEGLVWEM